MAGAVFGTRLRESRKAAGLSLRQLAARVGYDHSYLSQVERGQRPGSADLARLCDRELGIGDLLTTIYQQADRRAVTAARKSGVVATAQISPLAAPVERSVGTTSLEAAWLGMFDHTAEMWERPPLGELRSTPPAQVLPELITDLRLLQAVSPGGDAAGRAAELSVHIAETLTALGQPHAARRWWRAARGAADKAGQAVRSWVLAQEVLSGLAERRSLGQLLETAEQAASGAAVAQAHGARALVLAELGRDGEALGVLQELIGVADELPSATTYEVHGVEGRVCARLGYGAAGCVLLARALELCPEEWVGERARLRMGLAECLAIDGEVAAGVALAQRVLVELPDEWHTYYLYNDGARVLSAVRERQPGLTGALQELLGRTPYLDSRSVGSGSWGRG